MISPFFPEIIPIIKNSLILINQFSDDDDVDEDEQPITMLPRIVQTAPSPSTEMPAAKNILLDITANDNGEKKPKNGRTDTEISQMESVL